MMTLAFAAPGAPLFDRMGEWLVDDALPLWRSTGFCEKTGGFLEALDLDGAPLAHAPRRVLVQFRQIYVFARAHEMGLCPYGLEHARAGFEFVSRHAWAPDGRPGWVSLLAPDGAPLDRTRRAYDQAFAMFGLSWYARASRDPRAVESLVETARFIESDLRGPFAGWREDDGRGAPNIAQNPHMHLFEAGMAAYAATADPSFAELALEAYDMFEDVFFRRPSNLVFERFAPDGAATRGAAQSVEPGHMVEWSWLLSEGRRVLGLDARATSRALLDSALRLGAQQPSGFLVDELSATGDVRRATRRLWPQTEAVRALNDYARVSGSRIAGARAAAMLDRLFDDYLSGCPKGTWRDQFDSSGVAIAQSIPASTLYHVFGCFADLLEGGVAFDQVEKTDAA